MSEDILKFILQRVINNAKDASEDYAADKSDFNDGKCFAYYEVLDTIKTELGFPVKIKNADIVK